MIGHVCGHDPETKVQSSQWKSPTFPHPKKARMSESNAKVMLTIFSIVKELSIMNPPHKNRLLLKNIA